MVAGTVLERFSFAQSWSECHNGLCQEKLYIVISTVLFQVEIKHNSIHTMNVYVKKKNDNINLDMLQYLGIQECPKPHFGFPCNKKQLMIKFLSTYYTD